jgi:hypothetical protein
MQVTASTMSTRQCLELLGLPESVCTSLDHASLYHLSHGDGPLGSKRVLVPLDAHNHIVCTDDDVCVCG